MTAGPAGTSFWCEQAWLRGGVVARVRVEVGDASPDGAGVTSVETDVDAAPDDTRLHGLVLPGLANTHSHAFHRALRGRTHCGTTGSAGDSFWTWREQMYRLAGSLTPDAYHALARATYAEMALAGVTAVGEFHYLRGAVPDEMDDALVRAAREAGVRLTLLDACYLEGGLTAEGHTPPAGAQQRFVDTSVDAWSERTGALRDGAGLRRGFAVHSVRAVPAAALEVVAEMATGAMAPLHVHLSEQPAENDACQGFYGMTPTELLAEHGVLGSRTAAVHATHLTSEDIALLGESGTSLSLCPTTERDLADGIGPARALVDAGSRLHLGSDSHAMIDLFEEARGAEAHERLVSGRRGVFTPAELVDAMTVNGHSALGWPDAGRIDVGAPADLVAVRLDSARTAGVDPAQLVMAATAADVTDVVVGGRVVVSGGQHVLGDVGELLTQAVSRAWRDADAGGSDV